MKEPLTKEVFVEAMILIVNKISEEMFEEIKADFKTTATNHYCWMIVFVF